jgi:hypothetical protein
MSKGHSTRRTARLTALAVATGTLVAVGAAPAGAASAAENRMTASGAGSALKITLNLPAALAATGLPTKVEQTISLTDGSVSTVTEPLASTTAILGKGTTPVLSGLLNRLTAASLSGQREQRSAALPDIDQNGFKLSILPLVSKVADPALDGTLAQSTSGVARVAIGGLALPTQLDAVTAPVTDALETALGATGAAAGADAAAGAVGTVGATVNDAISTLNGATQNTAAPVTAPVQAAIDSAVATLTETLTDLTGTVDLLSSATDLITIDSVISDQVISRKGDAVTSTVENTVKGINVLNGLVKISAVESAATAVAGGKPGSGSATTKAPVLDVSLADGALSAIVDETGLNVGGTLGGVLPAELQGTVNGALDTVNGLLAETIGLDVQIGKGATSVSPDGTSSAAAVNATTITINPLGIAQQLGAGTEFLKLELVTANAAVGSQLTAAPNDVAATTPVSLPRTGGETALAAVAVTLIGGALAVRRRRATV